MTRSLPATAWLPARTDLIREASVRTTVHAASAQSGGLSLTVTVEEQPDRAARQFAFRAARLAERRTFSQRSTDQDHGAAFAITDQLNNANSMLDHHDPHNSSCFLAGVIAQARPGAMLHNPRYCEAAGAYRRSDLLGIGADQTVHRSDKKV